MLSVEKPNVVFAWVCSITGVVWDETWAITENYAAMRTRNVLGKRRMERGSIKLVRVTIEPLSEVEAAEYRAGLLAGQNEIQGD